MPRRATTAVTKLSAMAFDISILLSTARRQGVRAGSEASEREARPAPRTGWRVAASEASFIYRCFFRKPPEAHQPILASRLLVAHSGICLNAKVGSDGGHGKRATATTTFAHTYQDRRVRTRSFHRNVGSDASYAIFDDEGSICMATQESCIRKKTRPKFFTLTGASQEKK